MDKKYYWIAGAVVVLVVVALLLRNRQVVKPANNQVSSSASQSSVPATQTAESSSSATVDKTYGQLVNQYVGNRIQFADTCQASPNNMVFKNGTTIMLDNRANVARTIKFNSTAYYLGAYGYKLVTLSYSGLPKTILVDCGSSQNVATITVEK